MREMREVINSPDAVMQLGNWLSSRGRKNPYWITRKIPGTHDGYDLYRPAQMDFVEQLCYEDVLAMARKSEFVRVME